MNARMTAGAGVVWTRGADAMPARDTRKYSPFVHIEQALGRQRLLDEMFDAPPTTACLVMIVAPAGFGKTTLLAQAQERLRAAGESTLWINCEEADKSADGFLVTLEKAMYLAAMACPASAGMEQMLSVLESSAPAVSLFLDQYERAWCVEVDRLIERFANNAPANVRVFIGSRQAPLIPVARLQLRGVVRLLEPDSLRFTHTEVEELLGEEQRQLASLWAEYSEGWPFALQLMRLGSRHWETGGVLGSSDRPLPLGQMFEYLAEEVFSSWSDGLRDFMLDCSILEDVDVTAANELRDREDGAVWLHQAATLSPIVLVSERPLAARLHPLLRDFLRNRLEVNHPARYFELQRKAAYLFARRKNIFAAVAHSAKAGLFDLACAFILEAGALRLLISEGTRRVKSLLELLPNSYVRGQPRLRLMLICLRLVGDGPAEGLLDLSRLEALLEPKERHCDEEEEARVDLAYARAIVSIQDVTRDHTSSSLVLISPLLRDARARFFEDPRYLCLCLPSEILFLQRYGRIGLAIRRIDEFIQINRTEGFRENAPWSAIYKALSDFAQARFAIAVSELNGALREDQLTNAQLETFVHMAHALLGQLHYAMGDLVLASQYWSRCANPLNTSMVEVWEGCVIGAARAEFFQNRVSVAVERLVAARASVGQEHHLGLVASATLIELYVRAECYAQARALADDIQLERLWDENQAQPDALWADSLAFAQARFWLHCAEQGWPQAIQVADSLVRLAQERERWTSLGVALLLRAHARLAAGGEGASGDVAQAMNWLRDSSGIQYFIEVGELVIDQVREQIETGDPAQADFARAIIAGWENAFRARVSSLIVFTAREQDVLMGIATGKSTKLIAKELAISPETVKHYLKAIFSKLGVGSRQEAVVAARRRAVIA